jgi:hypothetical protein
LPLVFGLLNCIRFCRHAPEHIGWVRAVQSSDAIFRALRIGPARENRRGYLPARNRADDQEWFCSVRNFIRQLRIW